MCGIAGHFEYAGRHQVSLPELEHARKCLATRGPDDSGIWQSTSREIGLVHTRLSILDTSDKASQPMLDDTGKYTLVFNGEIYNFAELRKELESSGYSFKSTGDSEVLLYLYKEHGPDMLRRLRGMFAFAIWDSHRQELLLARDPLGIKPLYYSDNGHSLRFASQVKTLVSAGGVDLSLNAAGLVGFLAWGSVPEPHTLYRGIQAVPSGHYVRIKRGGTPEIISYFSIVTEMLGEVDELSAERSEMQSRLDASLRDSIRQHLVSDVPLTVFLSSGIDSATLAAIASTMRSDVHTTTLGFDEFRGTVDDETRLSGEIATRYGVSHTSAFITRSRFEQHQERLLSHMDQPSIDGVNTYFISMIARELGFKVALSGIGGDELFGGYPSFRQVPFLAKASPFFGSNIAGLGRTVRNLSATAVDRFASPKVASLLEFGGSFGGAYFLRRSLFMPWEIEQIVGTSLAKEGWESLQSIQSLNAMLQPLDAIRNRRHRDFAKVAALELTHYMRNQLLRDADWSGMAHSVEIRVPFVDPWLYKLIFPLHNGKFPPGKRDMTTNLKPSLPSSILARPKTGFSVPVRDWLPTTEERGLRGWARRVLEHFQPGAIEEPRSTYVLS